MEAVPPLKVQPAGVPPELEELELLLEELLDDELELLELLDELELLLEELELLVELELLLDEPGPPQPNMAMTGAATMAEPMAFTMFLREASGFLREASGAFFDKARVWSSEICFFISLIMHLGGFPHSKRVSPMKVRPSWRIFGLLPVDISF